MLKEKHLLKKEVTDASIVPKEQFPIQGQGMVSETHDVTLFLLGAYLKGAPAHAANGRGICVAVSGGVPRGVGGRVLSSVWCTYLPMLLSPRSPGNLSVSTAISPMRPCVRTPGARPCWSPLMLASC